MPSGTEGSARTEEVVRHPRALIGDERVRRVVDLTAGALLFYFVLQYFFPAPMGILVKGMVLGGLTALVAFGIAIVYRANRIVNFAQGDLGAVPAVLAVLLIVGTGWPYPLAVLTGIAAGAVLGLIVETLIIRRFFNAPRLILTVATLFVSSLLAGVALILPIVFDIGVAPHALPAPFEMSFEIFPVVFHTTDMMAVVAIPVIAVGLTLFLRYTHIGIAVRASAESADRAFLLGIPVKRIHTIVWVLSALLATTAMMLRAGIVGIPIGSVLGPTILLGALGAAVIGRFERLPTIFVAAVALGVLEQSIVFSTGRSIIVDPILFVVIIGALLLQRRGRVSRAEDLQASSWQAAEDVRPIPRELVRLPEVAWGSRGLILAVAVFLVALPLFSSDSRINLAGGVMIYAIIGISLVVLTGWAGQVSLGQMAFVGIGAAVAGAVTSRIGWDFLAALILAGLAGALVAVLVGLPALRIRGLFLAVATFAFALATSSYFLNRTFFGWWLPVDRVPRPAILGRITIDSEPRFYYVTLVGLALAIFAARSLRHSRAGRVLIGTRENERGVQAFGVNVIRAKLTAFALSGFLAAYAGALLVHHQERLGTNVFLPQESLAVFVMVVIGGLGSIPGALLGALWFRGGLFLLPPGWRFLATGFGGLLILMVIPGGLGSVMYRIRDAVLRRIAVRRGLVVPSLLADVRVDDEAEPAVLGTDGKGDGAVVMAAAAVAEEVDD